MTAAITLRPATADDAEAIAGIYAYYVLHSRATFEEMPPDGAEIAKRLAQITAGNYPFLVAEQEDKVVGYAYAGPYKERASYRITVEDSVYLADGYQGQGIGGLLLEALIQDCAQRDFKQMMAVICSQGGEGSVALHAKHGFTDVGTAKGIGMKFGEYLDVTYMQRPL